MNVLIATRNNLFTIFVLLMTLSFAYTSCSKEEMESNLGGSSIDGDLLNGRAEIRAILCKNLYCTEIEVLTDVEVQLTSDTLVESGNTLLTNEVGEGTFTNLQDSTYVIKASYGQQQFIERFSVTKDGVSYHEMIFSPFCSLVGNRLKDCNRNISFENLSVGQISKYLLYKSIETQGSASMDFEYTEDTLSLEVVEKVGENRWLVQERFTRLDEFPDQIYSPTDTLSSESNVEYFLVLRNDSLIIEVTDACSYLFYDYWCEGMSLDFKNYDHPRCTPDGWYSDCGTSQYNISVEDPQFLDFEFDGVFKNGGGADIGLLYNGEQGLIHMFIYPEWQNSEAYGFTKLQ